MNKLPSFLESLNVSQLETHHHYNQMARSLLGQLLGDLDRALPAVPKEWDEGTLHGFWNYRHSMNSYGGRIALSGKLNIGFVIAAFRGLRDADDRAALSLTNVVDGKNLPWDEPTFQLVTDISEDVYDSYPDARSSMYGFAEYRSGRVVAIRQTVILGQ